jgi:hypothetical protein
MFLSKIPDFERASFIIEFLGMYDDMMSDV